jgi:hypothetical protein
MHSNKCYVSHSVMVMAIKKYHHTQPVCVEGICTEVTSNYITVAD